jgi:hypothetical protein
MTEEIYRQLFDFNVTTIGEWFVLTKNPNISQTSISNTFKKI